MTRRSAGRAPSGRRLGAHLQPAGIRTGFWGADGPRHPGDDLPARGNSTGSLPIHLSRNVRTRKSSPSHTNWLPQGSCRARSACRRRLRQPPPSDAAARRLHRAAPNRRSTRHPEVLSHLLPCARLVGCDLKRSQRCAPGAACPRTGLRQARGCSKRRRSSRGAAASRADRGIVRPDG